MSLCIFFYALCHCFDILSALKDVECLALYAHSVSRNCHSGALLFMIDAHQMNSGK